MLVDILQILIDYWSMFDRFRLILGRLMDAFLIYFLLVSDPFLIDVGRETRFDLILSGVSPSVPASAVA